MNKNVLTLGIAVIVGSVGFAGGMTLQKQNDSLKGVSGQDLPKKLQSLGLASGGFGRAGGADPTGGRTGAFSGRRGGGAINGDIIAKDDKSITVKQTDGSTKIVYYSDTTRVATTNPASATDLAQGKQVVINGAANTDGSVTAQTIQIRPAQSSS